MSRRGADKRTPAVILMCFMLAYGSSIDRAQAVCNEAGISCHGDFSSLHAVAWTEDVFTVAGQTAASKLALLRVTRDGQARSIVEVSDPPDMPQSDAQAVDVRKLIPLPGGGLIVLADVRAGDGANPRGVGWALRIDTDGTVNWSKFLQHDSAGVIFHSGHYDEATDSIVIVGRRTTGADYNNRCENWSQSLIHVLRAQDGKETFSHFVGATGRGPANRQALLDIARGPRSGTYVVAGFASAGHAGGGGRCQDNMLVGTLTRAGDRWSLAEAGKIGGNTTDENALSIAAMGSGRYVVAGQGREVASGAPAAQAYRIRLAPFTVEVSVSRAFPADGSDKLGWDRYRIAIPLSDSQRLLLAGLVANGKERKDLRAIWQVVSADLTGVDALRPMSNRSSYVADAAVSPEGKVLAVGRTMNEQGHSVGWLGFVATKSDPIVRRPPDANLTKLTQLPQSAGRYRVPASWLPAGVGYSGTELAASSSINLVFTVPAAMTVKITSHTNAGDLDLVLKDAKGQMVSFSNSAGSATEMILATLEPGEYMLTLMTHTQIGAYEIRMLPASPIGVASLRAFQKLSEEERIQLGELLNAAGYKPFSNPTLAVGGESARALLAAQEGALRPVGPGGIGRAVAQSQAR